jgi:hypothetical protein
VNNPVRINILTNTPLFDVNSWPYDKKYAGGF